MSEITTYAPTAAHSLRTTVLAAALVVAGILAVVAAASAPATTATVAVTVAAVLGAQRVRAALRDRRRDAFAHRNGDLAPQRPGTAE